MGESFWKNFAQKTAGDLLESVIANMPSGAPGSLSESTYADIVGIMLKSNGFPAGRTELGPNTIADVQIIQKDGSAELPTDALARVVGCLVRNGLGDHERNNAEAGGTRASGSGRRREAPRQPYDAAEVRADPPGCVGRFARRGDRTSDRCRRRGRHKRNRGKTRR